MDSDTSTSPFFSYKLLLQDLGSAFDPAKIEKSGFIINTINPHSFYVAEHDSVFKEALIKSDILLPDGIGVVCANWLINGTRMKRISGMDVFIHVLKGLAGTQKEEKRVFFLGSTNSVLAIIKQKVQQEYPNLQVGFYSPPYKASFTPEDQRIILDEINSFDPDVLFIGLTAPKQEKWAYQNYENLNVKILCSVGAVFDFYSGNVKRPGKVWQALGLEWFIRFLREPVRLWRRNFISLPYFLVKVMQEAYKKNMASKLKL